MTAGRGCVIAGLSMTAGAIPTWLRTVDPPVEGVGGAATGEVNLVIAVVTSGRRIAMTILTLVGAGVGVAVAFIFASAATGTEVDGSVIPAGAVSQAAVLAVTVVTDQITRCAGRRGIGGSDPLAFPLAVITMAVGRTGIQCAVVAEHLGGVPGKGRGGRGILRPILMQTARRGCVVAVDASAGLQGIVMPRCNAEIVQTTGRIYGTRSLVGVADDTGGDGVIPVGGAACMATQSQTTAIIGAGIAAVVPAHEGAGNVRLILGGISLAGENRAIVDAADIVNVCTVSWQGAVTSSTDLGLIEVLVMSS